jgi:phage terminase small subunit
MHPPAPPRVSFFNRRELFCQHYAAGAGGAEAVRRAGYSPNGAKQRACFLLRKPEIRLHIEALRAERRGEHQRHLADAIAVVDGIIADAVQASKSSVALRAVEFKLKLHGVIRDKRIDLFSYNDTPSPDADLENVIPDPKEDLDGMPGHEYAVAPPKARVSGSSSQGRRTRPRSRSGDRRRSRPRRNSDQR